VQKSRNTLTKFSLFSLDARPVRGRVVHFSCLLENKVGKLLNSSLHGLLTSLEKINNVPFLVSKDISLIHIR
jgi:hypothetical protein